MNGAGYESWLASQVERRTEDEDQPLDRWDLMFEDADR